MVYTRFREMASNGIGQTDCARILGSSPRNGWVLQSYNIIQILGHSGPVDPGRCRWAMRKRQRPLLFLDTALGLAIQGRIAIRSQLSTRSIKIVIPLIHNILDAKRRMEMARWT